jgi:hypothetical protein
MRYVARALRMGVANAWSFDYLALSRWAVKRAFMLVGVLIFLVGLMLFPLPIPLGIPLMSLGVVIILNTSTTAKKMFVRRAKKHPDSVGRIRTWIRARRRTWHRRRRAAASAAKAA